jgi:beta-galactosidase/beta-glucuronidase
VSGYPWDEALQFGRGHPRPLLRREGWLSLDGTWDFARDADASLSRERVKLSEKIVVPFSLETKASGIGAQGYCSAAWYRRRFAAPVLHDGARLMLRFGAVDHAATVWLNGHQVASHRGGYTPFSADLTPFLVSGEQELVVRAEDQPLDLTQPRGKQDWKVEPHSIWYPRTTGIWQTVWLEVVPRTRIDELHFRASLHRWELALDARLGGEPRDGLRLAVKLRAGDRPLVDDTYVVMGGEVHRRISLSDPGIDDSRNELLWSPESPTLIEASLELWGERGEKLDHVHSYTALRSIATQGDRILLNGRPYPLRLVLDQGYWRDSGLTAPDDAALKRDVQLARAMGFNGVRKHQKLEDPRYLFWADRLGLLVWEEMPSAYRYTQESIARVTAEWMEAIARDKSHPCIVAWVPFNESWGVPNLPDSSEERHFVQALYHLTRTLDPTRLVIGNDGWESVATDVIGIHDYEDDARRLAARYSEREARARLFRRERPGGRLLVLDHRPDLEHPLVLSEFGGITESSEPGAWGYSKVSGRGELAKRYAQLLEAVRGLELFSGFCYTQLTDTYQEANGLLTMDRVPKFPIEEIAKATRGGLP